MVGVQNYVRFLRRASVCERRALGRLPDSPDFMMIQTRQTLGSNGLVRERLVPYCPPLTSINEYFLRLRADEDVLGK